jgi:hypothetical protein
MRTFNLHFFIESEGFKVIPESITRNCEGCKLTITALGSKTTDGMIETCLYTFWLLRLPLIGTHGYDESLSCFSRIRVAA